MKHKYILYLILLFIASLNFNMFIKPNNIICGGTQGLALIINKFTKIDNYYIILIINILMIIISKYFLNNKITISLIISSFIYPVFIYLTKDISISINNIFINIIIIGIISGVTNGYVYKLGFSLSGINIISLLINKYYNIKIGTASLFINSIIILFNIILFSIKNLFYAIIIIFINSLIINIILYKNLKIFLFKR